MSEIQSVADPTVLKWGVGVLVGSVNFLIIYIFRNFRKDFFVLRDRVDVINSKVDRLETEHKVFHRNETGL